MYEKKIAELMKQLEVERAKSESAEEQLDAMKKLSDEHKKLIQVSGPNFCFIFLLCFYCFLFH